MSIDLDDDDLVTRFAEAARKSPSPTILGSIRDALEQFAPKPKPEEPTLIGAVVRDGGSVWVRTDPDDEPWKAVAGTWNGYSWREWGQFSDAAEVLHPGVQL